MAQRLRALAAISGLIASTHMVAHSSTPRGTQKLLLSSFQGHYTHVAHRHAGRQNTHVHKNK